MKRVISSDRRPEVRSGGAMVIVREPVRRGGQLDQALALYHAGDHDGAGPALG